MKFNHFRPTLEMLSLVGELDEFKGAWRSLSNIRKIRKRRIINSHGGAALSDELVEALLSGMRKKSFRSGDEQEVAGYADVMNTVFENWQQIPITENHIKQLHRDLLKYTLNDYRHRGSYKTVPNNVEAFGPYGESLGVVFKTATLFDTPYQMTELVAWTN